MSIKQFLGQMINLIEQLLSSHLRDFEVCHLQEQMARLTSLRACMYLKKEDLAHSNCSGSGCCAYTDGMTAIPPFHFTFDHQNRLLQAVAVDVKFDATENLADMILSGCFKYI